MRRKDREVTDPAKIQEIIDHCTCCRIGFNADGEVYIVPVSFGYEKQDDAYTLYFHGAKAGRKFELAQTRPSVGFEMDTNYQLTTGDTACSFSARFQSIIGTGRLSLVEDFAEKAKGLNRVMLHTSGQGNWEFNEKMLASVAIFKLEVTGLSCKEHE